MMYPFLPNDVPLFTERCTPFYRTMYPFLPNDVPLFTKQCTPFYRTMYPFLPNSVPLFTERCAPFYRTMCPFLPNDVPLFTERCAPFTERCTPFSSSHHVTYLSGRRGLLQDDRHIAGAGDNWLRHRHGPRRRHYPRNHSRHTGQCRNPPTARHTGSVLTALGGHTPKYYKRHPDSCRETRPASIEVGFLIFHQLFSCSSLFFLSP